jgi:hypothetical protein
MPVRGERNDPDQPGSRLGSKCVQWVAEFAEIQVIGVWFLGSS